MKPRWFPFLLLALAPLILAAQEPQYQELPEEDEDLVQETEYTFNPIQAKKEFQTGNFYWKKKSWRAAAGRFEEAVKWDPGFAEAYFRLGVAKEKLADDETVAATKSLVLEEAANAFRKYLELEPDGKLAKDAKRNIERLERPQG